jgi:carbamoyltransferase
MNKIGIHPFSHDSSICMINHDEKEIFAISTERVSRYKHDYRFVAPLLDKFCDINKDTKILVSIDDVNVKYIEYFNIKYKLSTILKPHRVYLNSSKSKKSKIAKLFLKSPISGLKTILMQIKMQSIIIEKDQKSFSSFLAQKYGADEKNIKYIDHHFSHACSTYYSAPINFKNNSLIMTLDGQGDGAFCKVFIAKNNIPFEVSKSSIDASIPLLYSIFTSVAGFTPNADEGKLEALACYGNLSKENELYKVLNNAFQYNKDFEITIKDNNKEFPFYSMANQSKEISIYLEKWKERLGDQEFSSAIQLFFEEFFLKYIKDLKVEYNLDNISLAGGAFANVKLNLRVVEDNVFDEVYIFHAMGDDGASFGALIYDDVCDGLDTDWIRDDNMPYYGTSYSEDEVKSVLENNKDHIDFEFLGDTSYCNLAKDIKDNKICALFQGKMEYGPRALGHRSILGNPRNSQVREDINLKFKKREWFQPFCPSILEEEREKIFKFSYPNKYMTCAFTVKDEIADELPSIVHVDNTARPQFVEMKDDVYYFNLLKELKKINKYGVVLNTSFNIHGKTIVMTPQDALDDFFACGIDALYIENFKVVKK